MSDTRMLALKGGESRLDEAIRNDPFPFYRALRKEAPVYYDPGLDLYLVTSYEDCLTVQKDDETYSLEHGYQDRYGGDNLAEFIAILERDGGGFIRDLAVDPPRHTRLRKLTEKAFTAHRVKELEPRIHQIVIQLIEQVADKGAGDGMLDIGAPLTAHVICEQLGFDWADVGAEKVAVWTKAVLDQIGRMQSRDDMLVNAAQMCELQNFIIRTIRARKAEPREDMISDIVHARIDGEDGPGLTFEEQVATIRAFLIAGNDTTAAAIGNLLLILATTPGLMDQLHPLVDNDRAMNRFVEEVLRLQPPVHGLFRTAMKEVVLGGTTIPAKAQICIMYASANDDDTRFPDPRKLDIERPNLGTHMTFGAGIHKCVGISLARMEIKLAAQEIIRRLQDIRLAVPADQLTWLPTMATHTLERLPLTFRRR